MKIKLIVITLSDSFDSDLKHDILILDEPLDLDSLVSSIVSKQSERFKTAQIRELVKCELIAKPVFRISDPSLDKAVYCILRRLLKEKKILRCRLGCYRRTDSEGSADGLGGV